MFEGGGKGAEEMSVQSFLGIFCCLCSGTVYASITVDLVCEGTTTIILNSEERSKKSWSHTYSIRNGTSGIWNWIVTEEFLRYQSPVSFPSGNEALIYEKMDHNIEINRFSGKVIQRFIYTINEKMRRDFGMYRVQIDEGICRVGKKQF